MPFVIVPPGGGASAYFPLVQPNFEATVPASFARNWEIFVRPRGGEVEEVTVYGDEEGGSVLEQPLLTGPAGRIGEGGQFGWVKGGDLPVDLWGRPKGREDVDWQVLPEGDQAVVAGGVVAEELEEAVSRDAATGISVYDPGAEAWEPRPSGFRRVVFVSPVHGAPDPADAQEFDEKVEPKE